ncbi:hypothetical protein C4J65_14765 [Streptomyces sp. CB09001]|nr:hypothetical protein C4J65_14765 [Streptomyces sp. CB09001]
MRGRCGERGWCGPGGRGPGGCAARLCGVPPPVPERPGSYPRRPPVPPRRHDSPQLRRGDCCPQLTGGDWPQVRARGCVRIRGRCLGPCCRCVRGSRGRWGRRSGRLGASGASGLPPSPRTAVPSG